jgi:hypothetical protein
MTSKKSQRAADARRAAKSATVIVRMPPDMKAWLDASARGEDRTITAKVIRCLAAEMKRDREMEKA